MCMRSSMGPTPASSLPQKLFATERIGINVSCGVVSSKQRRRTYKKEKQMESLRLFQASLKRFNFFNYHGNISSPLFPDTQWNKCDFLLFLVARDVNPEAGNPASLRKKKPITIKKKRPSSLNLGLEKRSMNGNRCVFVDMRACWTFASRVLVYTVGLSGQRAGPICAKNRTTWRRAWEHVVSLQV